MTEQLAPGRFSWCKLRIVKKNGVVIDEDRSDPLWWDNLDKSDILALGMIPLDEDGNPTCDVLGVMIDMLNNPNARNKFFHFKKAKMEFGVGMDMSSIKGVSCVVGMVTNNGGSAIMYELFPDGHAEKHYVNVVDMKLNLEQQGINLTEGW